MPQRSTRTDLLHAIDQTSLALANSQYLNILLDDQDSDTDSNSDTDSEDSLYTSDGEDLAFAPPSPISSMSPMSPLSPMSQLSGLSSSHSDTSDYSDDVGVHYDRLQHTIAALRDEVERARIFHKPDQPPPRAPQLYMLVHHEEHRPHLFRQKLRVNPEIFDDILDQISDHPIFRNQSNNPQLPVSIQLAIFLNRAGHYGNAISLEDVAQWAGVSVGSVVNCTNRVMVALLEEHDQFIFFPDDNSEDAELARRFAETRTCPEWRGGYLAIDGSTMDLFAKPAYFGETFYDRKSKYSLGCQVMFFIFIFHG